MEIPIIDGEWEELFRPKKFGNYVNDHCIYRDNDGSWNLIGITSFGGGPSCERYFVRAVSDRLQNMQEVSKVIDNGTPAWAPCVIENGGFYYMYYGPSPTKMAVSPESSEWFGYEIRMHGLPPMACHRDHFVLKVGQNRWLMYATGIHEGRGSICVLESENLTDWYFDGYALDSSPEAPLKPPWGAFESPFVVEREGLWYLFTTYTDSSDENYNDTLVFCSENPKNFGVFCSEENPAFPITKLRAHAPEVINCGGSWYITTCGWSGRAIVDGAVGIAKLKWKDQP
ncbi:MAG: hypothetical protein ACI4JR_00170 [Acutalibacteraceae bacterium]